MICFYCEEEIKNGDRYYELKDKYYHQNCITKLCSIIFYKDGFKEFVKEEILPNLKEVK